MAELTASGAAVVACHARPEALDALPAPAGTFVGRVAPDELMLLGAMHSQSEILDAAVAYLAEADPFGIAVDQSDGWSVWSLSGAGAREAFVRLLTSPCPREPAFVQGAIAGVPGKAVVLAGRIHLAVPAPLGHHLHETLRLACADLLSAEGPARPLELEPAPEGAPAP